MSKISEKYLTHMTNVLSVDKLTDIDSVNLFTEYKEIVILLVKTTPLYPIYSIIISYHLNPVLWDIKYKISKCRYIWYSKFNELVAINLFKRSRIAVNPLNISVSIELSKNLPLDIDFGAQYIPCQLKDITVVNWGDLVKNK